MPFAHIGLRLYNLLKRVYKGWLFKTSILFKAADSLILLNEIPGMWPADKDGKKLISLFSFGVYSGILRHNYL